MNMGKRITDLAEGSAIPGESRYPVSMGDGTGVKQVKHKTLVEQLLKDMEMPYDETLAMLTGTEEDGDGEENGKQKIPNLQAISDWIASKIVNSLFATEEGFFLDARIGKVLDQRIKANTDAITQINSDLQIQIFESVFTGKNGYYGAGGVVCKIKNAIFMSFRIGSQELVPEKNVKFLIGNIRLKPTRTVYGICTVTRFYNVYDSGQVVIDTDGAMYLVTNNDIQYMCLDGFVSFNL